MRVQFINVRRYCSTEEQKGSVRSLLSQFLSSEEPLAAAKSGPNRVTVSSRPLTASATVSMQNGFVSSSRSRREKPCLAPCPIARA
jgi:hypothetical protein